MGWEFWASNAAWALFASIEDLDVVNCYVAAEELEAERQRRIDGAKA